MQHSENNLIPEVTEMSSNRGYNEMCKLVMVFLHYILHLLLLKLAGAIWELLVCERASIFKTERGDKPTASSYIVSSIKCLGKVKNS